MNVIKYKYLSAETILRAKDGETVKQYFIDKIIPYNEDNEQIAKKEAYNGEYEVFDDGIEEVPTQLDRVESQIAYLAMMTGNSEILEGE